jgi:hypothetical protein
VTALGGVMCGDFGWLWVALGGGVCGVFPKWILPAELCSRAPAELQIPPSSVYVISVLG